MHCQRQCIWMSCGRADILQEDPLVFSECIVYKIVILGAAPSEMLPLPLSNILEVEGENSVRL